MTFVELALHGINVTMEKDKIYDHNHIFIYFKKEGYQTHFLYINGKKMKYDPYREDNLCKSALRYFLFHNVKVAKKTCPIMKIN